MQLSSCEEKGYVRESVCVLECVCVCVSLTVCVCVCVCVWFPGEPNAPKLKGTLQPQGNTFKVTWIKQDDGGSPITHYLLRYKAVS